MTKIVKGVLKFMMWLLITVFSLVLLTVIALYIPAVQRWIGSKATDYLSERTGTRFEVSRVGLAFPLVAEAGGIYIEDQDNDTLLAAAEIEVDIDPVALLDKRIQLTNLSASGLTAHITRSMPDSSFNFDFITEAFAADTSSASPKDPAAAWSFSIGEVSVSNTFFTYHDEVAGTNAMVLAGDLKAELDEMDTENMKFSIDHLFLTDAFASVVQYKAAPPSPQQEETPLVIHPGDIELENVKLHYHDKVNSQRYLTDIKSSLIKGDRIDVLGQSVSIDKVQVTGAKTYIVIGNATPVDSLVTEVKEEGTPADKAEWKVKVNSVNIENNVVRYYNDDKSSLPDTVLDPSSLYVTGLDIRIDNFVMKGEEIAADIRNISGKEKSGLVLRHFSAGLEFTPKGIELASLDLRTNKSRIGNYIKITYPSIDVIGKSPGRIGVNANFVNTSIAVSDVLMLDTSLANVEALTANKRSELKLDGKVRGRVSNLVLTDLKAGTGYATKIHVNGTVRGLPNIDTTLFDLTLNKVTTSARDIHSFVPDTAIPQDIALPHMITMNGKFKGTIREFNTEVDIRSSFGGAELALHMDTTVNQTNYSGTAELNGFNIGKLLKQEKTMGAVTGGVLFEGSGLSVDSMNAVISANIEAISLNNYTYKNLNVYAHIKEENVITEATIRDSSISFVMNGNVDISGKQPAIDMDIFLEGANLQKLNFTKDDIRVQGRIDADIKGVNIDSLNGRIALNDVLLIKNQERFTTDSIVLTAYNKGDSTRLSLKSPVVSANLRGQVKLTEVAGALTDHIESYMKGEEALRADSLMAGAEQDFRFNVEVKNPSMITEVFVPELELSEGAISGSFDKKERKLVVEGRFPRATYAGNRADSLVLSVHSDKDSLSYSLSVDEVSRKSYRLDSTAITGVMSEGKMTSKLSIAEEDTTGHELLIAGRTNFSNGTYRFHADSVVINYEEWQVPDDNYVRFGKEGLYFHNMRMENGDRFIVADNMSESVIEIGVNKFDIGRLARIVAADTPLVGGLATGTVQVITSGKKPVFEADLNVKNFSFKADTLGALALEADNRQGGRYSLDMGLKGRGNNIDITGYYDPDAEENTLDLNVNAGKINLSTFEGFSMGQLRYMKGTAAANLTIKGEIDDPDIEGNIVLEHVVFRPSYLGAPFTIQNEKVHVERNGIYFNSIVISDSLGNKALLDGVVYTTNFKYFQFDLTLKTKEFLALNTSKRDNKTYYGTLFINSIVRVQGSDTKPEIDVLAKIVDGSSLTFIVPEDVLADVERRGVVEFVDFKPDLNPILTEGSTVTGTMGAKPEIDIDFTANVEIDEGSEFRIVVNPATGDSLYVRGTSTFSFGIDPSGKITLIGSYEITEGSYQLSFGNLVKKRFIIQRGSRISWSGDPIAAQVDITAQYKVRTSPLDLVADQVTNLTESERQELRQQMQFFVVLNMEGRLLTPKIDFDIDLPPEQQDAFNGTVYARLFQLNEQESELNQQVFALIILNRFLPKNPLSAGGNAQSAVATAGRASASKLLTQQLNEFTSTYIDVVDISLSLDSYQDYVEGEPQGRTNMQVDVRKEALNERLNVEMGGNIELEGPQRVDNDNNNVNDLAADLSVEYKLTKDGRYRLRGIRRSGYVGLFDGRITETGVGVIFVRDYNRFRELFARPKEEEVFTDIKE